MAGFSSFGLRFCIIRAVVGWLESLSCVIRPNLIPLLSGKSWFDAWKLNKESQSLPKHSRISRSDSSLGVQTNYFLTVAMTSVTESTILACDFQRIASFGRLALGRVTDNVSAPTVGWWPTMTSELSWKTSQISLERGRFGRFPRCFLRSIQLQFASRFNLVSDFFVEIQNTKGILVKCSHTFNRLLWSVVAFRKIWIPTKHHEPECGH